MSLDLHLIACCRVRLVHHYFLISVKHFLLLISYLHLSHSCFSVTNDRTYMMDEEIRHCRPSERRKYIKWGADDFWDSHGIT